MAGGLAAPQFSAATDHRQGASDVARSTVGNRIADGRRASRQKVARARPKRDDRRMARAAETLTEQAYRVIEEQIVTLRLKPGDFLSEQMLSASYGFGRTPIRRR